MSTIINIGGVEIILFSTFLENVLSEKNGITTKRPKHRVVYGVIGSRRRVMFFHYGASSDYSEGTNELGRKDLIYALSEHLLKALAYENSSDFLDFCHSYGYDSIDEYEKAQKDYKECGRAHKKATDMFGSMYVEIYDKIQEIYERE